MPWGRLAFQTCLRRRQGVRRQSSALEVELRFGHGASMAIGARMCRSYCAADAGSPLMLSKYIAEELGKGLLTCTAAMDPSGLH
jgi:hypothetical protein